MPSSQPALMAPPRGVLVAAVAFDDQTEHLTRTVVSLAERFDMEARFVNVIDAMNADPWLMEMPTHYMALPLYRETQDKMILERRKLLSEVVSSTRLHARAHGEVISGDPAEAVVAYARLHRANMIVTACSSSSYRMIPKGFSTALSLMADAPLPVLVTSRERPLDFRSASLSILFCDDLQPSTHEAALRCFELAWRLGRSRVRQVHVHGDFREMVKDSWSDMAAHNPALAREHDSPESFLSREYEERLSTLKGRGMPYRQRAEDAGVKIEVDVRTGKVHDEIHEATLAADPDLLVFGRHKFFRARPFLVGRMSFRAMLHEQRSVLMVPPSEALYTNLPFPAQ